MLCVIVTSALNMKTLKVVKNYKILALEPCGRFYTTSVSLKELKEEYRVDTWLLKRLLRGEEWTITSTMEVFPIGTKVMIQEKEPLMKRLVKLLTTKLKHILK